ncbi:MAG: hypothetical protein P8Y70_12615 [Candidatus Lokiarchaeota archaeon]
MDRENQIFIISLLIVICVTAILTFIPIWQLIIIPGIIAGLINKKLRNAVLAGILGVLIFWFLYVINGVFFDNVYPLFDQFGALIMGSGYGWLLVILILLFGAIFGLLGGYFGNKIFKLILLVIEKRSYQRK